jgi:hypothetical protein
MAAAGVSYHVGREANSVYEETWNGLQTGVYHHRHFFEPGVDVVDPYYAPGEPASAIIPRVSAAPPGDNGSGDKRIQAYCFRMCLSDHPDNQIPFPMPKSYDASQYIGLLRLFLLYFPVPVVRGSEGAPEGLADQLSVRAGKPGKHVGRPPSQDAERNPHPGSVLIASGREERRPSMALL